MEEAVINAWLQAMLQLGALGLLAGILYYLFKIVPQAIKDQVSLYKDMLGEFHIVSKDQQISFEARNQKVVEALHSLERTMQAQQIILQQQTEQLREVVSMNKSPK